MPMRANIVGPPDVATRINASMAACHSAGLMLGLAGVLESDKLTAARQRYGIVKPSFPAAISHSHVVATVPNPSRAEYRRLAGRTPDRRTAVQDQTAECDPAIDPR